MIAVGSFDFNNLSNFLVDKVSTFDNISSKINTLGEYNIARARRNF